MVWDPSVKGSPLKSKVRWGIAVQMLGKAVQFKCPYTLRRFKSRSYLAIKLKEGINYYTFLGIKSSRSAGSWDNGQDVQFLAFISPPTQAPNFCA
jgi:hypothetical protein